MPLGSFVASLLNPLGRPNQLKFGPRGPKIAPRRLQKVSRAANTTIFIPNRDCSKNIENIKKSKFLAPPAGPTSPQDGPKRGQDGPRSAQDGCTACVLSHRTGGPPDISWPSSPIGAVSCTACVLSHRTGGAPDISWPSSPLGTDG